jgi:hypothetical protein
VKEKKTWVGQCALKSNLDQIESMSYGNTVSIFKLFHANIFRAFSLLNDERHFDFCRVKCLQEEFPAGLWQI